VMKEAGLTHGGFYGHFGSREQLVDEAVECALRDGGRAMNAIASAKGPAPALLGALVDAYLSLAHRDGIATSCAVATMANDVARGSPRARKAYTKQVTQYLDLLTGLISSDKRKGRRTRAIAALSALVGAVSMARAVNDEKLSREILKSAADELKALFAGGR